MGAGSSPHQPPQDVFDRLRAPAGRRTSLNPSETSRTRNAPSLSVCVRRSASPNRAFDARSDAVAWAADVLWKRARASWTPQRSDRGQRSALWRSQQAPPERDARDVSESRSTERASRGQRWRTGSDGSGTNRSCLKEHPSCARVAESQIRSTISARERQRHDPARQNDHCRPQRLSEDVLGTMTTPHVGAPTAAEGESLECVAFW
jgi:hypothetical protein